ncbi:MAG: hypothetical protein J6C40_00135 [Lentisphaeria bacterium]|nr:hypothetical protein [Lentisphaeria bacterium]
MNNPDFEIKPLVFPVSSRETELTVRPKFAHAKKVLDSVDSIKILPVHSPVAFNGYLDNWDDEPEAEFIRLEDGTLQIKLTCPVEDEYCVWMKSAGDGRTDATATVFVYALEADLYKMKPLKGDFHLHSTGSDGRESPEFVAAACRCVGMDFMALTDHGNYEPSLKVMKFLQNFDTEFRAFPGEEVHVKDNMVHLVNFGGRASVNDYFREDEERFKREEAPYETELAAELPPDTRFQVGASEWAFDKIREFGGIAIFSHPFWRPDRWAHNYIGMDTIDALMSRCKFDAVEVPGGFNRHTNEGNQLMRCKYEEYSIKKGSPIPVVGVSDSHYHPVLTGEDPFPFMWNYTVVLAEDSSFEAIADAIRDGRSTGVSTYKDDAPQVIGKFRICKYVYFLLREYFPQHDKRCREEGDRMIAFLGR